MQARTPGTRLVQQTIEVSAGQTVHFRIVVTNSFGTTFGEDKSFTSPEQAVDHVVHLVANVTAINRRPDREDQSQRGRQPPTASNTERRPNYDHTVPIPDESIGNGETPVEVSQHIENLEIGATYHFRVVAENQWGEVASGDQTFAFFTANCPNAHVRQESGAAYLPDCRAYELVSPEVAGAVQLFPGQGLGPIVNEFIAHPQPSNTGLASSPSRFAFWGGIGQINGTNPPNITQDLYVSTRTRDRLENPLPGPLGGHLVRVGRDPLQRRAWLSAKTTTSKTRSISRLKTPAPTGRTSSTPNQNSVIVGRFPTMIEEIPKAAKNSPDGALHRPTTPISRSVRTTSTFATGGPDLGARARPTTTMSPRTRRR